MTGDTLVSGGLDNDATTTAMSPNSPDQKQHQNQTDPHQSLPDASALLQEELRVRKNVEGENAIGGGNYIMAFFVNFYASLHIFAFHLISLETFVSICLSVTMTVYSYNKTREEGPFDGSVMDWVLLSFAVITPMSASIGMAFSRREQALQHLGAMKTTLWSIHSAHACWDWAKAGKLDSTGRASCSVDWVLHNDRVLGEILSICDTLQRLLTLPLASRARHRVTSAGKQHAQQVLTIQSKLHRSLYRHVSNLTELCEVFKKAGLPPNEATRIRQWERMVTERIELLVMIKKYRTPQALRSFARLFTILLPPFYAPYYGEMAKDLNSLAMGITFSIFTAIALTSLFESISQMEDPFVGRFSLDGIDVPNELGVDLYVELLDCRDHHYPDAAPYGSKSTEAGDSAEANGGES